jgi:hypothetical protein
MRFDEDKLEALRRWGNRLRETRDEETAAAGRAILLLIEEVERLRLELSRTRELLNRVVPASNEVAADPEARTIDSTLHERLQRPHGQEPGSLGGTAPPPADETGSSPESWIESLRRKT